VWQNVEEMVLERSDVDALIEEHGDERIYIEHCPYELVEWCSEHHPTVQYVKVSKVYTVVEIAHKPSSTCKYNVTGYASKKSVVFRCTLKYA
jgi:hypothetical protein